MTTNAGTMLGMPGKAFPQTCDSIKSADVADGPFSLILNQVENGVAAPMWLTEDFSVEWFDYKLYKVDSEKEKLSAPEKK